MYIKDILLHSANLLNLQNAVEYIEKRTVNGNAMQEFEKLLRLTNMVLAELSSYNIYVIKEQTAKHANGKLLYTSLQHKPIKILELIDEKGNQCWFKTYPTYLECDLSAVNIKYAFIPDEDVNEKITLSEYTVKETTIAMAVVAEYLLTVSDFDSAVYWHDKFVKAISSSSIPKNTTIKNRSFV